MNPYEVLGVPEGASQEEIRRAYLKLVKKYHPDQYRNNPLADLAEEKLKEINEAYKLLSSGNYRGNSNNASYERVLELINQGRLSEAQQLLAQLPQDTGKWHFCKAAIAVRLGRYGEARYHLQEAVRLEPGNPEYRAACQQMNQTMQQGQQTFKGGSGGDALCKLCTTLYVADCCCECMGGDLISCC